MALLFPDSARNVRSIDKSLRNSLNDFNNTIRGWSEPASVKVAYQTETQFVTKPRLYILAVGVSNYQDRGLTLNFPAKDARDFADVMSLQKGLLYHTITFLRLVLSCLKASHTRPASRRVSYYIHLSGSTSY